MGQAEQKKEVSKHKFMSGSRPWDHTSAIVSTTLKVNELPKVGKATAGEILK
jgi:hypothetical protein